MKAWKAELFLLTVTLIWGGTFIFTKIGLNDCPPSLYILFRFTIAFIISFIFFGKNLFKLDKSTLLHGAILGLFFGGGFLLQTYGLKFTSVSKSAFITGIAVVLTPIAYWIVERKKILLWQKAGVVIAAVGLWIFTNPNFNEINIGDVLTLFSTVFWALYITYMDVFTRDTDSMTITSQLVMLQFTSAMPLFIISFFLFDSSSFYLSITSSLIYSLAYNSIIASFILTFIHTSIQKFTTPVKVALIFSLEPVVASSFAMIFINEILSGREYIGGAILLFGVLFSETGEFVYSKIKMMIVN